MRIYGVVRFADLGMLFLRPISFSSTSPFAPLTHPPNLFCTLTQIQHTPCGFSEECSLWDSCSSQYGIAKNTHI